MAYDPNRPASRAQQAYSLAHKAHEAQRRLKKALDKALSVDVATRPGDDDKPSIAKKARTAMHAMHVKIAGSHDDFKQVAESELPKLYKAFEDIGHAEEKSAEDKESESCKKAGFLDTKIDEIKGKSLAWLQERERALKRLEDGLKIDSYLGHGKDAKGGDLPSLVLPDDFLSALPPLTPSPHELGKLSPISQLPVKQALDALRNKKGHPTLGARKVHLKKDSVYQAHEAHRKRLLAHVQAALALKEWEQVMVAERGQDALANVSSLIAEEMDTVQTERVEGDGMAYSELPADPAKRQQVLMSQYPNGVDGLCYNARNQSYVITGHCRLENVRSGVLKLMRHHGQDRGLSDITITDLSAENRALIAKTAIATGVAVTFKDTRSDKYLDNLDQNKGVHHAKNYFALYKRKINAQIEEVASPEYKAGDEKARAAEYNSLRANCDTARAQAEVLLDPEFAGHGWHKMMGDGRILQDNSPEAAMNKARVEFVISGLTEPSTLPMANVIKAMHQKLTDERGKFVAVEGLTGNAEQSEQLFKTKMHDFASAMGKRVVKKQPSAGQQFLKGLGMLTAFVAVGVTGGLAYFAIKAGVQRSNTKAERAHGLETMATMLNSHSDILNGKVAVDMCKALGTTSVQTHKRALEQFRGPLEVKMQRSVDKMQSAVFKALDEDGAKQLMRDDFAPELIFDPEDGLITSESLDMLAGVLRALDSKDDPGPRDAAIGELTDFLHEAAEAKYDKWFQAESKGLLEAGRAYRANDIDDEAYDARVDASLESLPSAVREQVKEVLEENGYRGSVSQVVKEVLHREADTQAITALARAEKTVRGFGVKGDVMTRTASNRFKAGCNVVNEHGTRAYARAITARVEKDVSQEAKREPEEDKGRDQDDPGAPGTQRAAQDKAGQRIVDEASEYRLKQGLGARVAVNRAQSANGKGDQAFYSRGFLGAKQRTEMSEMAMRTAREDVNLGQEGPEVPRS